MVARDDSVIRGSLIASLVLLVLSIALNIFFWTWGDSQASTADAAKEQLTQAQRTLQDLRSQGDLMKSMLGVQATTEAERDELIRSVEGDETMQTIIAQYRTDMSLIGQEIDPQNQNYPAIPKFFADSLRSKNDVVTQARKDVTETKRNAENDVENARKAQAVAEKAATDAKDDLANAQAQFAKERAATKVETAKLSDQLTKTLQDAEKKRRELMAQITVAKNELRSANTIIESQKQEINRLKNDRFETFQGEITSVRGRDGGNVVNLNLGSADQLRPGVTFGVLDGDALRPEEANVKATIQVTKIRGQYIAEARVVARPDIRYPITTGDKVYSPFWAPGRRVKIALVGAIDIDGDGLADNEAIKSQIRTVGAEVVDARVEGGQVVGLDNSVRFLVEGTRTELVESADDVLNDENREQLQNEGILVAAAKNQGVTVIPFWKLEGYLRTIDDKLTTPLGTAVRASDFEPIKSLYRNPNSSSDLPAIYREQVEGMQRGNVIRP